MLRQITIGSLALLGLAVGAVPGRADVFVRLPFVGVYVGQPGVQVRAPFVRVDVPNAAPVAVPVQVPAPRLPSPPPVVVAKPLTLDEFAASFKPAPGTYQALLINPLTKNAVKATFTLPAGNPIIRVFPRRLEFDYGRRRQNIEIRFDRKDRVHVQSR